MAQTAINITDLSVYYRDSLALDNVSASIEKGQLLAVIGPNGAGKSTLIKSIMKQIKPNAGSVELAGVNPKSIAYLPQSHQIDRKFPISVREFVSAGAWKRTGFWRRFCCLEQADLEEALTKVNLEGIENRQINTLSGGQFQRVLFARMLMQDADVLLLDEPFNAIDAQTTEELMGVINHCCQKGKTVIAVVHDLLLVQRFFPNTMLLSKKLIAYGETSTVMKDENLIKAGYHFWNPSFNAQPHQVNQPNQDSHTYNDSHSQSNSVEDNQDDVALNTNNRYPVAEARRSLVEKVSKKALEASRVGTKYDS